MISPFQSGEYRKRSSQRGSILVICMVLAALGTIGVAAWVSLLDARGHQVEASYEGMKRRATLRSSKALARDALYANHLHTGSGLASDVTYTIPGNPSALSPGDTVQYTDESVASVTIKTYAPVPLQNASTTRTTKNGISPIRSYTTDIDVVLNDNVGNQTASFQLRSYNPVLGGDLLTMHPAYQPDTFNTLIAGNLRVNGRAVFWDAAAKDFKGGLRADEYIVPNDVAGTHSFLNTLDNSVLPLNYPIPKQTTGFAGSNPSYQGELDLVDSATNGHNDYATRWAAAGLVKTMSGFNPSVVGPGPATAPDGADDATLESEITAKTTDELMASLPFSYPLSSRLLRAVADKSSPSAFTADQLYTIFSNHFPIPNDALSYLTITHELKISPRAEELHTNNQTAAHSDGIGKVEIFLNRPSLPHLILESAEEIIVHGQAGAIAASAAASMSPVGIAINNTGSDSVHTIDFRGQNKRRIVFAVSTEQNPTPPTYGYDAKIAFTGPDPFPEWHMVLELQNTGALIGAAAVNTATIVGGIRGSRPINVYDGTLILNQQFNVEGYETLLSRNAWVEAYLAP
ncbi:MAG: hypothetical protein P1U87_19760 [Verrucomicrobiales bacterium]|nr:hypothetical protein [Verrucomicrobiales bacterium]